MTNDLYTTTSARLGAAILLVALACGAPIEDTWLEGPPSVTGGTPSISELFNFAKANKTMLSKFDDIESPEKIFADIKKALNARDRSSAGAKSAVSARS